MPLQQTSGAASYDAFGGGVAAVPKYIEEYFSTFLYSGTGAAQTITNGIDLATKGGLVWYKRRSGVGNNVVVDTSRGMTSGSSPLLNTNTTDSQTAINNYVIANTTGFSFGSNATGTDANASGSTYVSWSIAKAPKFFDVVTFTLNSGGDATFSHSLGSVPGSVFIKSTGITENWYVYHRSLGQSKYLNLNLTGTGGTATNIFQPTSTDFTFGLGGTPGATYVAYLFAHNAGGFGLTGTDNVISCGLTTANGSGDFSVTLGYEPQWVLIKSTGSGIWSIVDNMRGATASSGYTSSQRLQPQSSAAEDTLNGGYGIGLNATGFTGNLATFSNDFIYIAIRRGPMKVPTSGTSVFAPVTYTGTGAVATVTTNIVPSLNIIKGRGTQDWFWTDMLRGSTAQVRSNTTGAEAFDGTVTAGNTSFTLGVSNGFTNSGVNFISYSMLRAPSFFDEVCYTGTGGTQVITHNLGVTPEFIIAKRRNSTSGWYCTHIGLTNPNQYLIEIQSTAAQVNQGGDAIYNRTSTTFTLDTANTNAGTYVAYLFATCAGVSKCTAFTGTGTLQTINCGFTAGSRFVLIKRTDAAGDWYVWDSSRGLSSSTDPYLLLNSTAAEVTSTNWVDTTATGFQVTAASGNNVNISGASYIALAIA